MDELLLSRIEDASLNASAPPQQRWLDGWIVRMSPGKARRARCINAVAPGRLPVARKLELAAAAYAEAALPMVVRITPFTLPADLDGHLEALRWTQLDDTRVMVLPHIPPGSAIELPPGTHWLRLDAARYADEVGRLRASPKSQCRAHAERLALSPVPYQGYAIGSNSDGAVRACGQFAREAELVGLYDVFTHESDRGKGLARLLCKRLLALAAAEGAEVAYLQVESDNHAARRVYRHLGFSDAYSYHYRQPPGS